SPPGRPAAARPPRRYDRLPVALPPGLMAESPEVAAFLVRVPGLVLVVDGYNASLRRWPDRPIAEQRQRLVDALAGLSARTGGDVHVVFDGSGSEGRSLSLPRRGVRVTFTPADVEADETILRLVAHAPAGRPVAVATDDRRVRREAAARGANALTQDQLFAVLGLET
ncbi:MAG TPA: NYN domain-containing protein, partial [Acidimicrobiales bacterium]|nr:NYN domain-containing protein [Acidimicrobiales bacterium]